ncbi:MAG: radical SAM protein [Desulfovibrio sp.]|jgi:pyruvate formate lyase activating enzyme|nr:radical SAM protein [Desulfovibrio sp.]
MPSGLVFDIKELALNDGPGSRVTVFLQGCPLRCLWCHNPEGQSAEPFHHAVTGRSIGRFWSDAELAAYIVSYQDFFTASGGGVTFSGGEPLSQSAFLFSVASRMPSIHKNLDTSGYAATDVFDAALRFFDLVYFDVKGIDPDLHRYCTGKDNGIILRNLRNLAVYGTPFHIRVPLIPDLTDTEENLEALAVMIKSLASKPSSVDLLPTNRLAAGKYPLLNREYPLQNSRNWVDPDWGTRFGEMLPGYTVTYGENTVCTMNKLSSEVHNGTATDRTA